MQLEPDHGEAEPSARGWGGAPPRDEAQLPGAQQLGLQKSGCQSLRGRVLHQVQWARRCQLMPWLPRFPSALGPWQGEGGPGPWGGGPAPRLAGSTASLGSRSRSAWWLCFPSMRLERAASRLQTDVSAVPSLGEQWRRLLQGLSPSSPEQTVGVRDLALPPCSPRLFLAGDGRNGLPGP